MNRNVYLLALCQALLTTGNILLVAVNALVGKSLTDTPALVTLPVAVQFIGLMMTTIPASLIMARIGRKRGFMLGNVVGIVGAVLAVAALYTQQFALYCLSTFLIGIGIGFGTLYRFAVMEVCDEAMRNKAVSMVMGSGILAAFLGPGLAIVSRRWWPGEGFEGAFVGLMLLYVLALVLLSLVSVPEGQGNAASSGRTTAQLLRQPRYLAAVLSGMISYGVMVLVMTATPLAMQVCNFSFDQSAQVIQWHILAMFAPSFFTGRLMDRYGVLPMMMFGALFLLAAVCLNLQGQAIVHFTAALVLLGIGWNLMFIGATRYLTECYRPEEKARAQACNEFLVFSVVAVASLASGWLQNTLGWYGVNVWMIPFLIVGLLILSLIQWSTQRQATAEVAE
ncbi:MFS transporter [Pokkaliibacter sp. MBI-7]|uniref:MFS transporter n=1 Tax=Pokkaliibacter sp. MBI-7 TaxID=3040600 RepID=UPI00244B7684|nr:MFS transporter [Pokkaliibacter sp. MBI-7]MDH2436278.1 MFS transporter [Pokkaliibacter sp. MBI-7]